MYHVFIHDVNTDGSFKIPGTKMHKDGVIKLLKAGQTIMTLKWNYGTASWQRGALVEMFVQADGDEYLRTKRNETRSDNLENLLNGNFFLN